MKAFPEIIVFDVDGVLVDVHGSFHVTVLETVKFFTGKRVTHSQLHAWKNRPGFNDDWKLSTTWIQSLGGKQQYDEVKAKFIELYWGKNGAKGNVLKEKWLLGHAGLRKLAKKSELGIFTGRVWKELDYTLDRNKTRDYFKTIVTAEDVALPKPAPEGLLKILNGRAAEKAAYLGDNVDDALAAQAAKVPFIGVLPVGSQERRQRGKKLKELGARAILDNVNEVYAWLAKR